MRVTMTESRQASLDGTSVVSLTAGEEYDLPVHIARRYLERGQATEAKAKGAAPENRAEQAAPENKAPARAPRGRRSK